MKQFTASSVPRLRAVRAESNREHSLDEQRNGEEGTHSKFTHSAMRYVIKYRVGKRCLLKMPAKYSLTGQLCWCMHGRSIKLYLRQ